jgi:hypothetical protein
MTGAWNEVIFPREGQEAWLESYERIVVLGNNGREVVVPQLPSDATHRFEGVQVTTHQSLERLAMRELDVQFPAVTLDQTECIQFPRCSVVDE